MNCVGAVMALASRTNPAAMVDVAVIVSPLSNRGWFSPLQRQFGSGLLRHHVRSVPGRPVRVTLPGALLVLPVSGLRTAQRLRQVIRRGVRRVAGHTPWEPSGDLLQQPAIAVGVLECRIRAVAPVVRRRTADKAAEGSGTLGKMECLAHLYAALQQVRPRSLDVGNHQEHALGGSWRTLAGLSEVDRAWGSRRGELDRA